VTMNFAADFADLFEVKGSLPVPGATGITLSADEATIGFDSDGFRRFTHVRAPGAFLTGRSATFLIELPSGGEWTTELVVAPATTTHREAPEAGHHPHVGTDLNGWLRDAPELDTDWSTLNRVYQRSLRDLAALRFYPEAPRASLPAAGVPWYMALFGRDSLLASYQALPFVPELARTTLRALADRQATNFDDWRDAEPGKILHELRHGSLVYHGKRPQSPYYGTCDATPLFLILLDEYERWSGDTATVRDLEPNARAALDWIERHGDLDGDGYLEYQTRNPTYGLANQCWKDSDNSILYPDGRLASLPRATCEIQGYAYDARVRTARLARAVWHDDALATRLEADAAALRDRFNHDFWLPDQGFYALALDGEKRPVPTCTSNPGHLLWSGIVPEDRVGALAGKLLGPQLFSGWGIRTLASGQPAFNPLEYHNGTVWPHDNAIIAAGLARYGRHEEAGQIAVAMLDAAAHFDDRLPEVFAGEDRQRTGVPIPYPNANWPQAWACTAPLLLIRVLLGLEPAPEGPVTDPHLPDTARRLTLTRLPGRWGRAETRG
jgi:glycogen debranching enzyme